MQLLTKKIEYTTSAHSCLHTLQSEYSKKSNIRLHLKSYVGNGRYTHISEREYDNMYYCLLTLNIPFAIGNDAPRGGVCGDYIELSNKNYKKAIIALKELTLPYPRKKCELAKQLSYINNILSTGYNFNLVKKMSKNQSLTLTREELLKKLEKFNFKATILGTGRKKYIYDFPLIELKSLINFDENAYKIVCECYQKAKGDQSKFTDLFLEHKELIHTQAFQEIAKCTSYNSKLWYIIRELFGDKEFKTDSDIGSVSIISKDHKSLIALPNGYGDGTSRVAIFNERNELIEHLMKYFTVIEGEYDILNYDCLKPNEIKQENIVADLKGRYGVYYHNGFVAFVRWEDKS